MAINLANITLTVGDHPTRDAGVCLLEAVAWWAGESHTDRPECVSPVLGDYGRTLNDLLPRAARQQLLPLVPAMAGTVGDGLDEIRGYLALDWLVRIYAPTWLELAGLEEHAQRLRELAPITDLASASAVIETAQSASSAAQAVAWVASAAAWDSAGDAWYAAKAAAWDVASGAWDVARGVAVAVAETAAETTAWDVRIVAWDARIAAWDSTNAAWESLPSTVADLQTSATDLLQRMIRPDQP